MVPPSFLYYTSPRLPVAYDPSFAEHFFMLSIPLVPFLRCAWWKRSTPHTKLSIPRFVCSIVPPIPTSVLFAFLQVWLCLCDAVVPCLRTLVGGSPMAGVTPVSDSELSAVRERLLQSLASIQRRSVSPKADPRRGGGWGGVHVAAVPPPGPNNSESSLSCPVAWTRNRSSQ